MRISIIGLALLMLSGFPARADQRAAAACVTALPEPARKIYDAVIKAKSVGGDLAQSVREQAVALVQAGQLPMSSAPDSALVAARCLELQR